MAPLGPIISAPPNAMKLASAALVGLLVYLILGGGYLTSEHLPGLPDLDSAALGRYSAESPSNDVCRPPTRRPETPLGNSSWFRCLNDKLQVGLHRCYFKDVCLFRNGTMVYYTGGEEEPPELESPMAMLVSREDVKIGMPVTISRESLPENANWYSGVVAFFQPFTPENFGHAMDDNFFPLYRLLSLFNLQWDEDVTFLTNDNKPDACNSKFKIMDRHCQNLKMFGQFLGRGTWSLAKPPAEMVSDLGDGAGGAVCTRHLVAGTAGMAMNRDQERHHDSFTDALLCKAGVDPRSPLADVPRIGIFNKTGQRRTRNTEELADAVRERFGVEVDIINVAKYTLVEQMFLMQNYTLIITPCGGISFTTTFLPYGAAAIYIGHLERWLWSTRLRVRDFFYLPSDEDLVYNRTLYAEKIAAKDRYAGKIKRNADNIVNIEKMLQISSRALKWVSREQHRR